MINLQNVKARVLAIMSAAFIFSVLSGCNTMEGLGKDTEKVGEEIQEAVDEAD